MISSAPAPIDPPTTPNTPGAPGLPGAPDFPGVPAEPSAPNPAEPAVPVPTEPTVPLPPEPAPEPSGVTGGDASVGTAEPDADNAVEEDVIDAVDPGGQPD